LTITAPTDTGDETRTSINKAPDSTSERLRQIAQDALGNATGAIHKYRLDEELNIADLRLARPNNRVFAVIGSFGSGRFPAIALTDDGEHLRALWVVYQTGELVYLYDHMGQLRILIELDNDQHVSGLSVFQAFTISARPSDSKLEAFAAAP